MAYRASRTSRIGDIRGKRPDMVTAGRCGGWEGYGLESGTRFIGHSQTEDYQSVPNRNTYTELDYNSHGMKDLPATVIDSQQFLFPVSHKIEKPSQGDLIYSSGAIKNIVSVEDEEKFLYGIEHNSTPIVKNYNHGKTEVKDVKSVNDEVLSVEGKQKYDPTIENILKSIGFNVSLSNTINESAKSEIVSERSIRSYGSFSSEPSSASVEAAASALGTIQMVPTRRLSSTLQLQQESYEERARRYREEQARLYAEANADICLYSSGSYLVPPTVGKSSLELLQSSYDCDIVTQDKLEIGKEVVGREVLKDAQGYRGKISNSESTGKAEFATLNPTIRTLYEDFSDSDDNLSESERTDRSEPRKTAGKKDISESFPVSGRCDMERDLQAKSAIRKSSHAMKPVESKMIATGMGRSSGHEILQDNVQGNNTVESFADQVKIVRNVTNSEANNVRVQQYTIASRWDSPGLDKLKNNESRNEIGSYTRDVPPVIKTGSDSSIAEKRQAKISSLNKELNTLSQQQKELMRRKQRGKYGHNDPELQENNRLQEKFTEEIKRLSKCTDQQFAKLDYVDKNYGKNSPYQKWEDTVTRNTTDLELPVEDESYTKPANENNLNKLEKPKPKKIVLNFEYFDDGNHWCRSCNCIFTNINELCQHLHSARHRQNVDLNHRPWATNIGTKKESVKKNVIAMPVKGAEFLMPAQAYFCSLCSSFAGDMNCATDHVKSYEHNENYKRFLENDTMYEHHYNLDKEAAMLLLLQKDIENQKKFGSGAKRPANAIKQTDQNLKRARISDGASKKKTGDSDVNKPAPRVTTVLPEAKLTEVNDVVASDSKTVQRTEILQKKPSFIGKMPRLKASARNKSPDSTLKNITSVKGASNKAVEPAEAQIIPSQATEVQCNSVTNSVAADKEVAKSSSKAEKFNSDLKLIPLNEYANQKSKGCLLSIRQNKHGEVIKKEVNTFKSHTGERTVADQDSKYDNGANKMVKQDAVLATEEMMSLGDFEILDECDAE